MKLNWKAGILHFVIIQLLVITIAYFLSSVVALPVRFMFEQAFAQDLAMAIVSFVVEMIARYIIFFTYFKNNRNMTFSQFCLDYLLTFVLRAIFCLCTFFAFWSAGSAINLTGIFIAGTFIDKNIETMQQVPTYIYIVIFVIYECFTVLTALLAEKTSSTIRKKEREKLLNNSKSE